MKKMETETKSGRIGEKKIEDDIDEQRDEKTPREDWMCTRDLVLQYFPGQQKSSCVMLLWRHFAPRFQMHAS